MLLTIDPALLAGKGSSSRHDHPGRVGAGGARAPSPLADMDSSLSLSPRSDDLPWPSSASSGYLSTSASSTGSHFPADMHAEIDPARLTAGNRLARDAFDGYDTGRRGVTVEEARRALGFTLPIPPASQPRMAARHTNGISLAAISGSSNGNGMPIILNRAMSASGPSGSTGAAALQLNTDKQSAQPSSSTNSNGNATASSSTHGRKRKKKYSRSRLGCLTCRQRKVRCDEGKPICEKCSDLERVCVWPDNAGMSRNKRQSQGKADSTTLGSNSGDDAGSDEEDEDEMPEQQAGPGPSTPSQMGIMVTNSHSQQWAAPVYPQGLDSMISLATSTARMQTTQARAELLHRHSNGNGGGGGGGANPGQMITLSPTMSTSGHRMSATPVYAQQNLPIEIDTDDMINQFLMNGSSFMSPGDLLGNYDPGSNSLSVASGPSVPRKADQIQLALPINGSETMFSPPKPPQAIITMPSNGSLPQINAVQAPANLSLTRSALVRRRNATRTPPDATKNYALQAGMAGFQLNSQMMPDPFFHAFPLASHRRLFHHFLNNTSSIVVALGLRDRSKNPLLAVSLPMITLDNENPARAALRMAVLSLGAVHLYHVHKTAAEYAVADGKLTEVQVLNAQADEMMDEARKTKKQALGQMMLSLIKDQEQHIDILLATCSTIKTRDVLYGDLAWKDNVDFAIRLIYKQGGPAAVIAADPGNFVRRFFVESLATTDVFSTFSTGQEPMLLGPWAPWWFDCERYNQTSQQWEAYERQYGISRGMCELIARCRACIYRASSLGSDADPMMGGISEAIESEARSLIEELAIFAFAQHDVPRQTRVSYGDSAYRYTMQICLYTEVLGKAASNPDVQTSVRCVLELCSEISQDPVILVWPLLSASAFSTSKEHRQWAKELFRTFKGDHCQDLVIAEELLDEQWRRMDRGSKFTPWYRLMKELGKQVLLI